MADRSASWGISGRVAAACEEATTGVPKSSQLLEGDARPTLEERVTR